MKILPAIVLAVLCAAALPHSVRASAVSPPPPPNCTWCAGPPPPPTPTPTPVPTVAPTDLAPVSVVSVKLSPTHFLRGHEAKLEVTASIGDSVIAVVQYHSAKSKTYKLKVGDSGSLTASWKVSANAPLGKGQIKVTVQDPDEPYSTSISFEVTK